MVVWFPHPSRRCTNLLAKSRRSLRRHSARDSPNAFASNQSSLRLALLRQFHTIGIVSNERALYFRKGVFVIQCKVTEPAHR